MKTFSKVMTSAAIATLLVASASSYAQVNVRNVTINANKNKVTTEATARGAVAKSRVGVITGNVRSNGTIRITANENTVTTKATARNAKACSSVGTIDGGSSGGLFGGLFGGGGQDC